MRRMILAAAALLALTPASPRAQEEGPDLPALLARALERSPALERARARIEAADARLDLARAAYRPTVSLTERFTSTTDPPSAFMSLLQQGRFSPSAQADVNDPERTDNWTTSAGMRWTALAGGRRRAAADSAEAEQRREDLLARAAERDVRFAVTEGWLQVATARAEVDLWQATLAHLEAHERTAAARHEEGAALRSEPLAVAVRRDDAKESLVAARRSVDVARARLAAAVGCPLDEIGPGPASLPDPGYARDEADVVAAARTEHPLVRAADASVEAATATERGARRGRAPSVFVEARGDWHGDDESAGFERSSWSAGVVADWTVADFGRTAAAVREASAGRLEAEAVRREVQDALELQARTAHARALEALERVGLADGSVAAATAALGIVEERWKAGLAPVVDLLEAQRSLAEARVRALDARAQSVSSAAAVERLAGPATPATAGE